MSLTEKIAIVTGASRGLGKAIAARLAKEGAIVIGTATTEAGADLVTNFLREQGYEKGEGIVLDMRDLTSVNTVWQTIQQKYAGIPSILVNNAGITQDNLLLRMPDEDWLDVIEVNLNAVFRLTKVFVKALLKARFGWGRVINISSVVGVSGSAGQSNYAAAKAGIIGFSKSLAQEIASRHITVNVIAPGFMDTDMTGALSSTQRQAILQQIPMGIMGQAQDIAGSVAFLTSEDANYITGITLHVNGGLDMR